MEKMNTYKLWKQDPSKGEVFTPIVIVNKKLDRIPEHVWKNPKSTFCDLSMGKGTYLIEVVNRLVNIYGYSEEDAKSRVFGYDIRVKYVNFLKRRGYKNVFHKDSLEEKFNMKFDVVLGNPPYQGKNKQDKLWVKFMNKSIEITKEGGCILMITPNSWTKRPDSKTFEKITNVFVEKQLLYVKLDVSNFFPEIGEKIGYQMIENVPKYKKTTIEIRTDEIREIDYIGQKIETDEYEKVMFSIFNKVEKSSHDRLNKFFSKRDASDAGKSLKNKKFSYNSDEEHTIPLLYTLNKVFYVANKNYTLGTKLFFNFSGYFFKENYPEKYMPILEGYISGQATFSVDTDTKENAEILRHNYTRKLIRFYVDKYKTGGFNTGIPNLPWLGYDEKFEDQNLYQIFGLTEKEIEMIEKTYDRNN